MQQEGGGGRMEQMNGLQQQRQDRRIKPTGPENQQPHQPQKCPRCESLNTKFCYYNNYSLSQPRYFCKTCRRYWTQGGTLRNVPVGGGCRKGKRSKRPSTAENQNQKQQLVSVSAATASNATVISKAETDIIMGSSNPIPSIAPASSSMYYPGVGGGGFLSSLVVEGREMGKMTKTSIFFIQLAYADVASTWPWRTEAPHIGRRRAELLKNL